MTQVSINTVLFRLPAPLRKALLGDARADLCSAITDHLLVFGNELLHFESGRKETLAPAAGDSANSDDLIPEADTLALVAKRLLARQSDERVIELYLASSEFLATSQTMPGVSPENLKSALLLQKESLLPSCDDDLALAVSDSAITDGEQMVTALWYSEHRLEALFTAFQEQGLMLAAVQPRVLAAANSSDTVSLLEEDNSHVTAVSLKQGLLTRWLQVEKSDLQQQEFVEQWEKETGTLQDASHVDSGSYDFYSTHASSSSIDYCFYPQGALKARKRVEKGRQALIAASLAAGLLLLSSVPFILQSLELRLANSRLQSTREMSVDARTDQAVVVDFENQWGTINDFPDQQVRQAMFQLQEVLGSEQILSLELIEGLIRIQGASAEPQAILQRLEQDPMFTEVVFSRATSNTRYYIDLRLATVNFEAYMVRYFPDES